MKVRKLMNGFFSMFYAKRPIKRDNIEVAYDRTKFKSEMKKELSHVETKSNQFDYLQTLQRLYSQDSIDYSTMMDNSEEKQKEIERVQEILKKSKEQEDLINSYFINDYSLKILEHTDIDKLIDLSCKSFVGSIDIPKDPSRSQNILELAKIKAKSENEQKEIEYYDNYFKKINMQSSSEVKDKASFNIYNLREVPRAQFLYARDIFKMLEHADYKKKIGEEERLKLFKVVYEIFDYAKEIGIYEASHYIGLMYLNGHFLNQNNNKAFYHFCKSAGSSHGISYFQLHKMIRKDLVKIYSKKEESIKKEVIFDYLKRSAEEGYLEAQYELGNEYMIGEICAKNYNLALAWHRQACRNGFLLSYEPCGDLFYAGGENFAQNKIMALVMYYTGYSKGNLELRDKVMKVREELLAENEPLPEMILV